MQRLHLDALGKLYENVEVLEVNDKFKEFEKKLPMIKEEMNIEYLHKILTAQTGELINIVKLNYEVILVLILEYIL